MNKTKIASPNLQLYSNDYYRYLAHRWEEAKEIIVKGLSYVSALLGAFGSIVRILIEVL